MTCDRIQPLLSSYHDDALSLEERMNVRTHVATCASCRAILAAYERMYTALRAAPLAAPVELRRGVYARISAMEARRSAALPFGPALLGTLRAAGGTAGLLAVLAALVFAATRLNGAPHGGGAQVAIGAQARVAGTAVDQLLGAVQHDHLASLPKPEQTVVESVRTVVAGSAAVLINKFKKAGNGLSLSAQAIHADHKTGAPHDNVPLQVVVDLHGRGATIKHISAGPASPFPTIAAGDQLIYLRLASDSIWRVPASNATAVVEAHALSPSAAPRVLLTPGPSKQLFTGVTSSLDGRGVAVSAMGLHQWGGVFGFSSAALWPQPARLFTLPDLQTPDRGLWHRYVKQVYPTSDGRLLFSIITRTPTTYTVSVAVTTSAGAAPRMQVLAQIRQPWYDYVVSPNRQAIAWTVNPSLNVDTWRLGTLQVANLRTTPATQTIGIGAHPVWSPDGRSILYLSDRPVGLYIWSARDGKSRRVVPLDARGHGFVSAFTWAPGGRYFAYVLTSMGPQGSSEVRLADSQTGYTWHAFTRQWIGAIAWAHGPSAAALAQGSTGAMPAVFDSTASAADTLLSFYNAVNRRDYTRAFSYITARDRRNYGKFARGYADTQAVTVTSLLPAPYLNGSNFHATTCLGFALLARHKDGHSVRYGGWYMLQSTTGQAPNYGGWRIVLDPSGTRINLGGQAVVPAMRQCALSQTPRSASALQSPAH